MGCFLNYKAVLTVFYFPAIIDISHTRCRNVRLPFCQCRQKWCYKLVTWQVILHLRPGPGPAISCASNHNTVFVKKQHLSFYSKRVTKQPAFFIWQRSSDKIHLVRGWLSEVWTILRCFILWPTFLPTVTSTSIGDSIFPRKLKLTMSKLELAQEPLYERR